MYDGQWNPAEMEKVLQPLADDEGTTRSVVVLLSDDTEDRREKRRRDPGFLAGAARSSAPTS